MVAGAAMCRRVTLWLLAGFGVVCLVILLLSQWPGDAIKHKIQSILFSGNICENQQSQVTEKVRTSDEIKRIIDEERESIRNDMKNYRFPTDRVLGNFLIEGDGKPIRSIILSTYRSGSSFLGSIIEAHPGNFYHFEPLTDFNFVQIRGPPLDVKAVDRIKALLNCEYEKLHDYLEFAKSRPWYFNKTINFQKHCNPREDLCYSSKFLSTYCQLFPFESMKLVRLRLNVAQELLADEKLNVRLVLLVRDPRGTMQSRKHVYFTERSPDSSDPGLLCADLVLDYKTAVKLQKKYPTTFRVIRYEDLATNPYEQTKELFTFLGRDFHPNVKKYIDDHTNFEIEGHFSTHRNSTKTAFHWRTKLTFEEVEEIQRTCSVAMEHWGYLPAMNATHQIEFNPLTDYLLN